MTTGETAAALASFGVLAQIGGDAGGDGMMEWLVQLGVRGLLVVGIVMLWKRMEKQDKADREERINQPADPHHHWRFRIHLDLNKLQDCNVLNERVTNLIRCSNR